MIGRPTGATEPKENRSRRHDHTGKLDGLGVHAMHTLRTIHCHSTGPLTQQCHYGSTDVTLSRTFWRQIMQHLLSKFLHLRKSVCFTEHVAVLSQSHRIGIKT